MRPHYANIWGNPSNSERNAAQIRRNVWHFDMILALPTINSTQIIPKHWILDKFFSSCFSSAKISTEKKEMNQLSSKTFDVVAPEKCEITFYNNHDDSSHLSDYYTSSCSRIHLLWMKWAISLDNLNVVTIFFPQYWWLWVAQREWNEAPNGQSSKS